MNRRKLKAGTGAEVSGLYVSECCDLEASFVTDQTFTRCMKCASGLLITISGRYVPSLTFTEEMPNRLQSFNMIADAFDGHHDGDGQQHS